MENKPSIPAGIQSNYDIMNNLGRFAIVNFNRYTHRIDTATGKTWIKNQCSNTWKEIKEEEINEEN